MQPARDFDKTLLVKLVALKIVTVMASVLVVIVTSLYFGVELPVKQFIWILGVCFVVAFIWLVRLPLKIPVTELEIFLLLLSDVLLVSLMIDRSGGSANPFTSYLLVPLALSAALLHKRFSLVIALTAVVVYASWTFGDEAHHMDHSNFELHIYGMWINFLITAIILFVFITYAMDSVKQREVQLQSAREKILRDEQLVAVASLTANTAHALGSPLSTMAILVDEWSRTNGESGELSGETKIFKEQIDVCKQYLASIGSASKSVALSEQKKDSVDEFFLTLKHHFQLLRPEERIAFDLDENVRVRSILQNGSLVLAVANLIENALQSGGSEVFVAFYENEGKLCISIVDDGPGLTPELKSQIGQPFISSKKGGWGLGVYLSNSTVEHFGGRIQMLDASGGGTETVIQLVFFGEESFGEESFDGGRVGDGERDD